MEIVPGIYLFRANGKHDHHVGDEQSSCFYFPPMLLGSFEFEAARFGRIEVSDVYDRKLMHAHHGTTLGIITAGYGKLYYKGGNVDLRPGDMFAVGPETLHLSVSDKDTTMIEHIVYLGEKFDRQDLML